jgi:serine/threonine protein kinase
VSAIDPRDFSGTSRFQIRRRLGAGGMGVVYEAFDAERRETIALKTLHNVDAQGLYRLKQEFRTLQDLQHPNLVGLGELISDGDQWFLTMELVPGTDFLSYVRPGADSAQRADAQADTDFGVVGTTSRPTETSTPKRARALSPTPAPTPTPTPAPPLDEARLRAGLRQLALGVTALHSAGIVHRDIKPSNILVRPDGRVVLLDFGLAVPAAGEAHGTETAVVGTAIYMAPEQGASKRVGPAADWYSVGTILYEALTGRPPFVGPAIEVLLNKQRYEPPPPRAIVPNVPPDLDTLCASLLAFEPQRRPPGREVLARLGVSEAALDSSISKTTSGLSLGQVSLFVGRDHELGKLRRAFADIGRGQPRTVILYGESGVGKSALMAQLTRELAKDAGAVVLSGRCYERESVPYKAFDGIVDALTHHLMDLDQNEAARLLSRDAPVLARVFPVLRRVPAMTRLPQPRRAQPGPQELRSRAFSALRGLLAALSQRAPLVLTIDDLQWADADSLALLQEVMHPVDAPALLLCATVRSTAEEPSELAGPLQGIERTLRNINFIHIAPLPAPEARELAEKLIEHVAAGQSVSPESIADEAAGHPLFIHELVRHAAVEMRPRSLRLDEALWSRIRRLELTAQTLLELVAVHGAPIAHDVLARSAGLEFAELSRWVAVLRVGHLVRTAGVRQSDTLDVYHDRVREAVLANLGAETLRGHHYRLAEALQSASVTGHDQQRLVRHLEAAGDPERAAQQAEQAAHLAAEALAFDRAAELYRTAIRLGSYSEAEIRALRLQLGDCLSNAGRGAEGAHVYLAAADGADAATRQDMHRRAAEQLLMTGHIEHGLTTTETVLREIGVKMPKTSVRTVLSIVWQRTKLRLRGLHWTPRDASEIPAAELTRIDVYKAVALGLAMVDPIRGMDFQCRSLLLALRAGEPRRIGRALAFETTFVASQGGRSLERARQLMEHATQIVGVNRDPYVLAWSQAGYGAFAYFSGKFRAAATLWSEVENQFRDSTTGTAWEINNARIFRMLSLRYLGVFRELGRWYDEYLRDAARRGDRYTEATLKRVLAIGWLARARVDMARADLEEDLWSPPEGGFHLQHWYALRAWAEVDLYERAGAAAMERARPLLQRFDRSLMARIMTLRAETPWIRGRLALAQAEAGVARGAALAVANQMARKMERELFPPAAAWASLLRAAIAVQKGDADGAVAAARRAAALAQDVDLQLCHAAATRRLGELLGGDEGKDLVAEGTAWMIHQGIQDPTRMTEVVAPGFGS